MKHDHLSRSLILFFSSMALFQSAEAAVENAAVKVWNIKEPPYSAVGNGTHDDTAVFQAAIADCPSTSQCTIHVPAGSYYFGTNPKNGNGQSVPVGLTVPPGKSISFVGDTERSSALIAGGFSSGQALLTYGAENQCLSGPPTEIQTPMVEVRNLTFLGTNEGTGLVFVCVTHSVVDRVLFQALTTAIICTRSSTNTFSNINTNSLGHGGETGITFRMKEDCNNTLILGGSFGSATHGILVEGPLNGISIVGSNCESVRGNCITLTPADIVRNNHVFEGRVDGVSVLNTHFEQVVGAAVYIAGPRPNSVLNFKFDSNVVSGTTPEGELDSPLSSQYALVLRSLSGF